MSDARQGAPAKAFASASDATGDGAFPGARHGAAGEGIDYEATGIPRPGDVVLGGKYRIDGLIGLGGMGAVMAATHTTLGQRVAMKCLLRDVIQRDPGAKERFLREARTVVNVQSEHVVRVMDVGVLESGVGYMLMEHLAGQDLGAYLLEHGPRPVQEAVDFVMQALDALQAAHASGIVHRDVKPTNLFLTDHGSGGSRIKVLDFGISKTALPEADPKLSLTRPGSVLGSPLYMSPEQLRSSKDVDRRTDIWSLGVVLYELLCGKPAWTAESFSAICAAIASDPAPPMRSLRPDVPRALEAVVLRCLEKDRERRYANVAELALALAPFASAEQQVLAARIARAAGARPAVAVSRAPSAPAAEAPGDDGALALALRATHPSGPSLLQRSGTYESSRMRAARSARKKKRLAALGVCVAMAIVALASRSLMKSADERGPTASAAEPARAPVARTTTPASEAEGPTHPETAATTPPATAAAEGPQVVNTPMPASAAASTTLGRAPGATQSAVSAAAAPVPKPAPRTTKTAKAQAPAKDVASTEADLLIDRR